MIIYASILIGIGALAAMFSKDDKTILTYLASILVQLPIYGRIFGWW